MFLYHCLVVERAEFPPDGRLLRNDVLSAKDASDAAEKCLRHVPDDAGDYIVHICELLPIYTRPVEKLR